MVELSHVTHLPRTPDYVRGLLNLRGHVIPVVDLRAKLGLGQTPDTVDTCVIVSEVTIEGERTRIGALADAVREVTEIDRATMTEPPSLGTLVNADFIGGLARSGDDLVMVLDFDRLFEGEALQLPGNASLTELVEGEAGSGGDRVGAPA